MGPEGRSIGKGDSLVSMFSPVSRIRRSLQIHGCFCPDCAACGGLKLLVILNLTGV